jgi:hypothetical protein
MSPARSHNALLARRHSSSNPVEYGIYYPWDDGVHLTLEEEEPSGTVDDSITVAPGAESYILVGGRQCHYDCIPGVTGVQHGDYSVTIVVTDTFANARMAIGFERSGVFIAGGWTPFIDIPTPGQYTFTRSDTNSTDWLDTNSLQLFIKVKNTGATEDTVTWRLGNAVSFIETPFGYTPPEPGGEGILWDGRPANITELLSYLVYMGSGTPPGGWNLRIISSQAEADRLGYPVNGSFPDGITRYFYTNEAPKLYSAVGPDSDRPGCICFYQHDIEDTTRGIFIETDARYGKVFRCGSKVPGSTIGDTNQYHGNSSGGAGQLSKPRKNHIGQTDYFATAIKVPSATKPPVSGLQFFIILSIGYETFANEQAGIWIWNHNGAIWWACSFNVGYVYNTDPTTNKKGDASWSASLMPVTFDEWHEWIHEIHWTCDTTGWYRIHHRIPGGSWEVIFEKLNTPTYLWGTNARYGSRSYNGTWEVMEKVGSYWANTTTPDAVAQIYQTGPVICSSLVAAKATFPD